MGDAIVKGIPQRRRHSRVAFSAFLRPQLRLPFGTHPVLDASLDGIRVLYSAPARPREGSVLDGMLEFPYGEPPLQFRGTVVRVEHGAIALSCGAGTIPPGYLLPTV